MSPVARYQQDIQAGLLQADASQAAAVEHLQRLYEELLAHEAQAASWRARLLRWRAVDQEPVRGVYLWGGVGRGKTYLMDAFFDSLPIERKIRYHFHRFMKMVHERLKQQAGQKNPLQAIAVDLAADARVLCFDEFFVVDIADAMILGGLMQALFERGVSLVATSNIVPDGLYKDGLQRARFLSAIELLNRHTEVVNVDGGIDYRLRTLERAELYYCPHDETARHGLLQSFNELAPDPQTIIEGGEIEIDGRPIATLRSDDDVVWFDFKALCDGPRSQNDYIEVARLYHAVILSDVPQLGGGREDQARRFINLVDEFYDRGVKLILSAAAPIAELYLGGRLEFEFERTKSRLLEMQSHAYLAREHKA